MTPIKTRESNFVYLGPNSEIADLPCRVEGADTYSVWELTEVERQRISVGANIRLGIHGVRPIPPVSLAIIEEFGPGQRVADPCQVCGQDAEHPDHGNGPGTHAFRCQPAVGGDQPDRPAEYRPVPVDVARQIAASFAKNVVVIVSWDRAHERIHTTTYGVSPTDKIAAARLGEILADAAGADRSLAENFEDFRTRTAAEWAQEKDQLLSRIAELERASNTSTEPADPRPVRPPVQPGSEVG